MPSPIAHLSVGYVLFAFFRRHLNGSVLAITGKGRILAGLCLFFAMLPDLDAVFGFATGTMGRYHNQWTHSLILAFAMALLATVVLRRWKGGDSFAWFLLFFSGYSLHIVMDSFTYGRGCRLLWPLHPDRFKPPKTFFRGLHWSEGFFSRSHIWTAIEDIAFGALLISAYVALECLWRFISRKSGKRGPEN